MVWTACINGVPACGLPKIRTSVGRNSIPTAAAAAAWSIRAIIEIPRLVTAAASRSTVSFGPNLLTQVINPSAVMGKDSVVAVNACDQQLHRSTAQHVREIGN